MAAKTKLKLLIVEDSEDDEKIIIRHLSHDGYEISHQRVFNKDTLSAALDQENWDVIISDHKMPGFSSYEALDILNKRKSDIPFLIVSGHVGEENAIEAMRLGAHDYIMKDNLKRLTPAIKREIEQSKQRKAHRKALDTIHHMAFHDPLTGLYNRYEFEKRLAHALESATERNLHHVLLYLDLDQFKVVNDISGHLAGDKLLIALTEQLKTCIRDRDTIARLGGDEFGVLLESCPLEQGQAIAEKIRRTVHLYHFIWKERSFSVGVSIGLVPINQQSKSINELLVVADMACYAAKEAGRNRIKIFNGSSEDIKDRRNNMRWVTRISEAIELRRFRIFRQDIISLTGNGSEHYCEFLLRLKDNNGELILPDVFLPSAERFGLMPDIDRHVVDMVFAYLSSLSEQERPSLAFINLSGATLDDSNFFDFLRDKLKSSDIPPEQLCFEVTETVAIADLEHAVQFINELRSYGCKFALDDFGSGMASFIYMKKIPVDFIKIDGSFILEILKNPIDFSIVESINKISHVAGFKTIAEFVTDDAIKNKVTEIGIDFAQGFSLHKPINAYDYIHKSKQ